MKKIVTFVGILVLGFTFLTACSNNSGNSGGGNLAGNSVMRNIRIVKPSELITLADANRIVGMDMVVKGELDTEEPPLGDIRTIYETTEEGFTYIFQVVVNSTASTYVKSMKSFYENNEMVVKIDGVGEWARMMLSPIHTLYIAQDDYFISISLSLVTLSAQYQIRSDDEEEVWRQEKLIEAGKLAVERLKVIIG